MYHPASAGLLVTPTGVQVSPPELQYEDRPAWLESRRLGIGSSDIAAICGLIPRRPALRVFLEKRGIAPPERRDARRDEAAEIGLLMEPVIGELVARRTGMRVLPHPGTVAHLRDRWMLASVDALLATCDDEHPSGILEKKCRSEHQSDEWENEVPWDVQVQVQWQMAVTGYTWALVAALIGGNHLVVHRIESDLEIQAGLREIAGRFWRDAQDGIEPLATSGDETRRLLTARWPKPKRGSVLHAERGIFEPLIERARHAKAVIADWNDELSAAENRIRQLAGDHETVVVDARPLLTLKASTHTSVSHDRLRADNLFDTYSQTTPVRKLQFLGEA